ncbi:hypothetical protein [Gilliamella intestini]|uniref:Invasin domain-containing protein n=1 Tax=Gilliamella intestini TaxID=1798183 RepID=A0A1C3ZTU7_9GAMM|nr:hypothetical protein [Gilliamella intestini]SCB85799.1 hypothetical protein GA0061080_100675 [Gilliamella intestini]
MKQNIKDYPSFFTKYYFFSNIHSRLTLGLNKDFLGVSSVFNTQRKITKITFFSAIFALNSFNVANAAISSTTSHTIQGTKPQFFATETAINKLGFNYKGNDYSEIKGNIRSDTTKYFDENTKLSEFVIKSYFIPRTTKDDLDGDYFDFDGDAFDPVMPITSTLEYVWKDSSGKTIDKADYDDIACTHNKYTMPLQLEITAKDIQVKTEYGDPKESDPVSSISKTYQIAVAKTCFAKPNGINLDPKTQWRSVRNDSAENDAQWNLTGAGLNGIDKDKPNPKVGGGHTDDYVINQGFKVEPKVANKHFPTTGFPGAQFQLVMGGIQQDYTFTSSSDQASVDKDGIVTLKSPVKEVTISATLKSDSNIHYDYKFTLDLWVEPQSEYVANQAEARSKCTSPMQLLERKDLNNASSFASANLNNHQGRIYNIFTRGIGLGVLSEWGRPLRAAYGVIPATYPQSKWNFGWYFTNENHPTTDSENQPITEGIVVASHDGMISFPSAWGRDEPKWAVCGKHL